MRALDPVINMAASVIKTSNKRSNVSSMIFIIKLLIELFLNDKKNTFKYMDMLQRILNFNQTDKKVNTLIAVQLFCVFCAVLATAYIKAFCIQLYS